VSDRYHVYPESLDSVGARAERTAYDPDERVVSAPEEDCALCQAGMCEQTEANDGVILHARPMVN